VVNTRTLAASLGGLVAGGAAAVGVSWARARHVPLSSVHGDGYIGPEWPDRRGLRGERVAGEMASLDAFARPGFDPAGVHPDVRALYEHTAEFEMTLDATWHHPFRLGAALATRWTSRTEQLNLPAPGGDPKRVESDLHELAEPAATADPRDAPRLWVRTDTDTGEGVFVALYASTAPESTDAETPERLVNVAVPLPGASLATVMRLAHYGDGLELSTDCPGGGLYLHTKYGGFALPASQRFRVGPATDIDSPDPPDGVERRNADVLADQRIRLAGLPLVTVRYAASRS
jgi:hypothetical protein